MQIDKNMIYKLRDMDSNQLKEAIDIIADSVGANSRQRAKALNNLDIIKKKLSNASNKDLEKIIDQIGIDKAEEIINQLKI